MAYTIEPFGCEYALYDSGRRIAVFNTRSDASLYLDRMNSPNYPFSDTMVFCAAHSKDHDICDVIECADCKVQR